MTTGTPIDNNEIASTPTDDALPPLASLKCNLCGDFFTDPLTLQCLHSFCHDCLTRRVQNANESTEKDVDTSAEASDEESTDKPAENGEAKQVEAAPTKENGVDAKDGEKKEAAVEAVKPIACPVCEDDLNAPMPASYTEPFENARLARIVKLVHETNVLCQNCSATASEVECSTCNSYLCKPCFNDTHSAPVFKAHKDHAMRHSEMNALPKCPQHPISELEFFCTDEEIGVCQVCLLKGDFVGRSYRLVADVRQERQTEIEASAKKVLAQRSTLTEAKATSEQILGELDTNLESQRGKVKDNFQAIREALDTREAEAIKALEELKDAKTQAVKNQLMSVERVIRCIDDGVNSTELVLNHSNDLELVYMTYVLKNHISNVSNVPSTAPKACMSCRKQSKACHCTVVGPELPVALNDRAAELVGAYAAVPSAKSVTALMLNGDKATSAPKQTPRQKELMQEVAQAANSNPEDGGCVVQ